MPLSLDDTRSLLTRKGRREHGRFLLEGPTLLEEALRSGYPLEAVYAREDVALPPLPAGVPVVPVSERQASRLSEVTTPPGIVAVAPMRLAPLDALLAADGALLLLAGINDPGNVGTLLRAADAFGVAGVIVGAGSADPFSPKVVRSSMGALFRLPLATACAEELAGTVHAHGRGVVAAELGGTPLQAFSFPPRPVIAVGNERHGVRSWYPRPDASVAIEQPGAAESLNAAVAGAIVLYQWSVREETITKKR